MTDLVVVSLHTADNGDGWERVTERGLVRR